MAVDSALKRRSLRSVGKRAFMGSGVTPDATPGKAWRQSLGHSYAGIAAAPPSAPTFIPRTELIV